MFTRRIRFQKNLPTEQRKAKLPSAAALLYDPQKDAAPIVLAQGQGQIAERILEIGKAQNIPIVEDALLTAALANVDIGAAIPPELYALVAEVLAYIYRIRRMHN